MQLGIVGLGRMGGAMAQRLLRGGHDCVVFDADAARVTAAVEHGARGASSLDALVIALDPPRTIWLMLPAGAVASTVETLATRLDDGDTIVDGGNSHYVDDIRLAAGLQARGLHYVDVGVSGGVWGLERGYCLMIGGEPDVVTRLAPIFRTLAPGVQAAPVTPGRTNGSSTADEGYLHCGAAGAGHFVKMVHNAIEYALMAAYGEGLNLLAHANAGASQRDVNAETAPLSRPDHYRYDFPLPDIAEVWRRGSVIGSWLLDLTAAALAKDAELARFSGRVADSGEGRWAAYAAVESGTPTPVLTTALFQRFTSRDEDDFAHRVLSAMRFQFGGHGEHAPEPVRRRGHGDAP